MLDILLFFLSAFNVANKLDELTVFSFFFCIKLVAKTLKQTKTFMVSSF